MASKVKSQRMNQNVYIYNKTLQQHVRSIVCGYVPEPYANYGKPSVYKRWEAERFLKKWISPEKASHFEIVDQIQETVQKEANESGT